MLLTRQSAGAGSPAPAPDAAHDSGLSLWRHLVLFAVAYALVISRKPDAVLHPQFWAEDGRVWFADAYNLGPWRPLFHTETGYFQTLPRIAADLSLLVPLVFAPLVLNLIAIGIHVLPVNLLASQRSAEWGSRRFRLLLAAAYIAIPSSPEICANITNEQWILALCAFLLLIGALPDSKPARVADLLCILLSGLTGPFCIFLLPISVLLVLMRREGWRWVYVYVLAACCFIQVLGLTVVSPTARTQWGVLGARFDLLARILGGNVFLGSFIGANNFAAIPGSRTLVVLSAVAILGLAITAFFLRGAPRPMKLLALYATLLLSAALALPSSYAPPGTGQWEMIAKAGAVRYWFLPTLTFIWLLFYGVTNQSKLIKVFSATLVLFACFGMVIQWRRPAFTDLNYSAEVRRIEAAPAGSSLSIPINPEGWQMRIIKRAGR